MRRALRLLLVLLALGFVAGGVSHARIQTGVDSFLPSSDPSMTQYEQLSRSFGGDAIVVLVEGDQARKLLTGDRLEELLSLEGELSQLPDVARVYGPATTLNQIAGQAQDLLAELVGRRDGLQAEAERRARARGASEAEVRRAGEQAVAGFDRRYGPLIVEGLPVGLPTLRNPKFVENVLYNADGEPRPQWHYLVPDTRSVAVLIRPAEELDQAATERLVSAIGELVDGRELGGATTTVAGAPSITAALGQQAEREIPILGAAAVAAIGACLLLLPWTSRRRRLVPLAVTVVAAACTVATLGWLGRPLSIGVVAFLPVLAGLGCYYTAYFLRGARSRVVLGIAAASAASFASLALSPLPFVRDLGLTFAVGIGYAAGLGWVAARWLPGEQAPVPVVEEAVPRPAGNHAGRRALLAGAALVAAGGWAALPSLPLEADVRTVTAGLPATDDATHVEDVMGVSGELAVMVEGEDVLTPEAWRWMWQAQQQIISAHGDEVRPVLSPPGLFGFLGAKPTKDQIEAAHRLLPPYLRRAVVREDAQVALLSYGVRLDDLDHLRDLTASVESELPPPPPGYDVELSGLPVVAVRGYELVSGDRFLLGLAGVLAAAVVLLVGMRRRSDVVRAVTAALLATGVELFGVWVAGIPLNPLTIALGSLTAAVACEFTVMMSESVRSRDPGLRTVVALAATTSAAGYAVLGLSALAVMQQFGLLLAGSVGLSWLAARFVVWVWPGHPAPEPEHPARHEPEVKALQLIGGAR